MELEKIPAEQIDRRNGGCGVIFENKLYVWGGNGTDVYYPYRKKQNEDNAVENRASVSESDSSSSSDSDSDDSDDDDDDDDEDEDEELDPDFEVKTIVTLPRPTSKDHPFDVLDLATNEWFRQPTSGDYPSLGLGSSLNVHYPSRTIILFSGFKDVHFDDEVYKVSPDTHWVWEKVQLASEIKPRERYLTGVIIHGDQMCVFGGVGRASREIGDPRRQQDPGAKHEIYVEDGVPRDYGWTSEYLEFNINKNEWTAPLGKDAVRPDQLGSHAFSKFDSHRAVLFGGNGSLVYSNACYIFDLDTRIWTGPYKQKGEEPWPVATRFATLTSLVDPERVGQEMYEGCGELLQPRMVLLWGKTSTVHISTETWLLNFDFDKPNNPLLWTQLRIGVEPRSWHIAEPVYPQNTTSCHIVVFGGNMYKYPGTDCLDRNNAANLKILHFGLASLMELCLNVIVSSGELMACAELRYPGYKVQQITEAHSRHINCSLITDITHFK